VRTRVGYSGGAKDNPTYYSLGDHTESLEIDYDPSVVSYAQLLQLFWEMHRPTSPPWSQQYKSAVFYHDEEQGKLAEEIKARTEQQLGKTLTTEILPLRRFWLAEDYHQKYYLRQVKPLARAYEGLYPSLDDFVNSTAVARVNGFVGGSGELALLENEIGDYGLDPTEQATLLDLAKNSHPIKCAY
jgi:peptide-methionine (S)-S-oxide reductase